MTKSLNLAQQAELIPNDTRARFVASHAASDDVQAWMDAAMRRRGGRRR